METFAICRSDFHRQCRPDMLIAVHGRASRWACWSGVLPLHRRTWRRISMALDDHLPTWNRPLPLIMLAGDFFTALNMAVPTAAILLNLPGTATFGVNLPRGYPNGQERQGQTSRCSSPHQFPPSSAVCLGILCSLIGFRAGRRSPASALSFLVCRQYFSIMLLGLIAASNNCPSARRSKGLAHRVVVRLAIGDPGGARHEAHGPPPLHVRHPRNWPKEVNLLAHWYGAVRGGRDSQQCQRRARQPAGAGQDHLRSLLPSRADGRRASCGTLRGSAVGSAIVPGRAPARHSLLHGLCRWKSEIDEEEKKQKKLKPVRVSEGPIEGQ